MIERYSLPEIAEIFSDRSKFSRYLEIELLATEAQAKLGVVPQADAQTCRAKAPLVDDTFVHNVAERELVTDHDVAAFVDVVQAAIGMPAGAWIHHGLTSTDVVDTAWCWMLKDGAELILGAMNELIVKLQELAQLHRDTVMIGRTHGIHAEPTTFGTKVALWALQVDRDRSRMHAAREAIAVCKLSGAVGTYSNISPDVEDHVADIDGLAQAPVMEQRIRHRAVGLEHVLTETLEQLRTRDMAVHDALPLLGFAVDDLLGVVETETHDVIGLRLITGILQADETYGFVEIHVQDSLASSASSRAFWTSVPTVRRSQPVMP